MLSHFVRRTRVVSMFAGAAALSLVFASACDDDDPIAPVEQEETPVPSLATFTNRSVSPLLVKGVMDGVQAFTLISSDDVLPESPSFVYGGSADGNGLLKNADGTYTYITNNEDNFSVSRITLDPTLRPLRGDYLLNSTGGRFRLCSATLATPDEHGFGPVFITAGESSNESQIHAVDPRGTLNSSTILTALGRWTSEQALPLAKTAFPGKTVILIGDDDSGTNGGQIVMYVSNAVGDLSGGSLYVLARTDGVTREKDLSVGQTTNIEFKQLTNVAGSTGAQLDAQAATLKAIAFGRTEDIDYRRGGGANSREIYFNVTGQATTGANANGDRSKYGRTYRLKLNDSDPTKGTLEVVLDGDDRNGPAGKFQNPDNITATTNYVYITEDPNGYGDESHDARMYQYNIATKELRVVMELDHRRTTSDAAVYNVGGTSTFGAWEFGGMIDVSEVLGVPSAFIVNIQPHSWTSPRFENPDGGSLRASERQASETLILKGLPR